jgi:hypothetical protein
LSFRLRPAGYIPFRRSCEIINHNKTETIEIPCTIALKLAKKSSGKSSMNNPHRENEAGKLSTANGHGRTDFSTQRRGGTAKP